MNRVLFPPRRTLLLPSLSLRLGSQEALRGDTELEQEHMQHRGLAKKINTSQPSPDQSALKLLAVHSDHFRTRAQQRLAPYLVGSHVRLQQGVLLLQVLHAGEVLAVIVRSQVTLHFVQPQFNVLYVAIELLLLVSLAEFYS